MAITLEQLDGEYIDQNISILVGKNFILKFMPEKSVFDSSEYLKRFINTPDLLIDPLYPKVRNIVGMSKEMADLLSQSIKTSEECARMMGGESQDEELYAKIREFYLGKLKDVQGKIIGKSEEIKKIEKETGLFLGQDNNLYFCENCNAYLGDSFETLPEKCSTCQSDTNWGKNNKTVRYLDARVSSYLNGLWLEDYIAKLFHDLGWKTWCHGSTMGSSGIVHQVDILAINSNDGRVLVCECKTAKILKEHIFDISTQFYDIKGSYGFLFSLDTVSNDRLTEYMKRTAGLCLIDNLKVKSDKDIIDQMSKFLVV